ncbi:MAG: hypothetical protein IT538_07745 [Variibacter sp.]|nr:hypothetical protein [Variibacter sp.]
MNWRRVAALTAYALLLAVARPEAATALTFEPSENGEVIKANGPIAPGDADNLRKLLREDPRYQYGLVRGGTTLHLNSPGGSVVAGIELANAIRASALMTMVTADSGCYSACTFTFLGGVKRTVLGKFGIHAMSKGRRDQITVFSDTDLAAVQLLTSTLINLTQSLVGDSRMITAMLVVPSEDIRLVPDDLLAEWRIITTAARPQQRMKASFDCSKRGLQPIDLAVCDNLTLADADRRMDAAFKWLKDHKAVPDIEKEQERWKAYRESCRNVVGLGAEAGMLNCVREAYDVRVRQLEGLVSFHEASQKAPAAEGWKPHTPAPDITKLQEQQQ